MTKLSNAFAKSVVKVSLPTNVISSLPTGSPTEFINNPAEAIAKQASLLGQFGFNKLKKKIRSMLPASSTSMMAPSPELIKGLSDPITINTIMLIWFNKVFGIDSTSRLNNVKHYLVLGLSESNMNSSSVVKTEVMYKGKLVPTYTRGQLQFITSTYRASILKGLALLNANRVLRIVYGASITAAGRKKPWAPSSTNPGEDPNQILANVGHMFNLLERVSKEWIWSTNGWRVITMPDKKCNATVIMTEFAAILKEYDMGKQLLLTFYHINGLSSLYSTTMSHKSRLASDPVSYYRLGRIPALGMLLADKMIVPPSLLSEKGDVSTSDGMTDDESLLEGMHLNLFIKKLYNFLYDHMARGTGKITSYFGGKRTLKNANTGVVSTHVHKGTDLAAVKGQPVFAMIDGTVIKSLNQGNSNFGNLVEIQALDGSGTLLYGHFDSRLVDKGTQVRKGDIIGLAGKTGFSTGVHVHIEWHPIIKGVKMGPIDIPKILGSPTYSVNAPGT